MGVHANGKGIIDRRSRIPTLLLFAIFAIAARYSPVSPGSPVQTRRGLPAGTLCDLIYFLCSDTVADEAGADVDVDTSLPAPPPGSMSTHGDGFLECAKELLDRTYANSRPSTCQALLLMGYREIGIGAMAQSWLYIGMAVRMVSLIICVLCLSHFCDDVEGSRSWYASVVRSLAAYGQSVVQQSTAASAQAYMVYECGIGQICFGIYWPAAVDF